MLTVAHVLNFLLMWAMPIALGVVLARRFRRGWGLWFAGAVTFILSQVVHIPLNLVLSRLGVFSAAPAAWQLPVSAAVLGLSAGLCEELARFLVLRYWRKEARSWGAALVFGAGHGGVEAIFVGVLTALAFVQLTALASTDLNTLGLNPEQLAAVQNQLTLYQTAPWPAALMGAVERLFALCVHLALTVMVMQVFTRRRLWWLAAAIAWHALTNAVTVYVLQTLGGAGSLNALYGTELVVGVFALLSLGIVFALRQPEPSAPQPVGSDAPLPAPRAGPLTPPPLTSEALKETKYQ